MAYQNGYFPMFYPQQIMSQPQQVMSQPQQPLQMQNGGFISVPSEEIVNTYPVAPGNCVTFKIEGKPIVMEKSMGFSQLESPRVERYRLVKEEPVIPQVATPQHNANYDEEIQRIWEEIDLIKKDFKLSKKKEVTEYEDTDA